MTMVQFNHRLLAITTFLLVIAYWYQARHARLPARSRPAVTALLVIALLQVILGITTLLMSVPIALAALHQATALLLFTAALYLVHSLRKIPM